MEIERSGDREVWRQRAVEIEGSWNRVEWRQRGEWT